MLQFTDTHVHLDMIEKDTDEVIRDAYNHDVTKMITIGVDLESSKRNLNLAERNKNIYAAIGFHPHESKKMSKTALLQLEEMLSFPKNIAIGEIGLDYYYKHSPKETQKIVFKQQIDIAKNYDLPIIIHNRDANEDTKKILNDQAKGMRVLLHCFCGDREMAQWGIRQGFYFGIGGIITFKNARNLVGIIKEIPVKNILLETDAPFLTPHPFRGKTNEPKYIPVIAHKIADIKDKKLTEIVDVIENNISQIFNFTM